MAMPSSTAIVLNSLATPPASCTDCATISPTLRRCTCPGTNWVKEFAIATMGLPKSASVMPVARQSARAPAMLRPWVEVRDRRAGIADHSVLASSSRFTRPGVVSAASARRYRVSHLVRGAEQPSRYARCETPSLGGDRFGRGGRSLVLDRALGEE